MATTGARVGERLRAIRRQKGLSLHDVEARSNLEFKASVLGAYERGERAISVPRLLRLAEIYEVPSDQLLPRELEGEISLVDTGGSAEPSTPASRSTSCACTTSTIPTRRSSPGSRRRSSSSARTSTAACSRSAVPTCACWRRCMGRRIDELGARLEQLGLPRRRASDRPAAERRASGRASRVAALR